MTSPRKPDGSAWQVLAEVAQRSQRYLDGIAERRVAPSREALAGLGAFDVPLQNSPMTAEQVVEELDRIGTPATMAIAGPGERDLLGDDRCGRRSLHRGDSSSSLTTITS